MPIPRLHRSLAATAASIALTCGIGAQPARPAFEVASVKQSTSGKPEFMGTARFLPGRFVARDIRLRWLIAAIYGEPADLFPPDRVTGGPPWVDALAFDIDAVMDAATTREVANAMARALLEDRFKLRVRQELREHPVYALGFARADGRLGPGLRPSSPADCTPDEEAATSARPFCESGVNREKGMYGYHHTLDEIAASLGVWLDRPVVNQTGREGRFTFSVKFAVGSSLSATAPPARDAEPDVFTAVREQFGLRLQPVNAPVPFIAIEAVEQPSEN